MLGTSLGHFRKCVLWGRISVIACCIVRMTCYVCLKETGGWNMQHDQSGDHLRFVDVLLMSQGAHLKPLPAGLAFNFLPHESSLSLDLAPSIFYLFLLSASLSALLCIYHLGFLYRLIIWCH